MKKTYIDININNFPLKIQKYLNGYQIYDSSCSNRAQVLFIDNGYYLKISPKNTLKREYENTKWFHSIGLGVEVIEYISLDKDYLLTKAAQGKDCTECIYNPYELCEILAITLKKIHSINYDTYFYKEKMKDYLSLAFENLEKGLYEDYVLLNRFGFNCKEEVIKYINENVHKLKDDTLLHGDFCLPNIIIDGKENITLIDLDHAGIGDKHIDLFWAIWSLSFNLKTEKYNDYFLNLYGKDNYDESILKLIAAIETFG